MSFNDITATELSDQNRPKVLSDHCSGTRDGQLMSDTPVTWNSKESLELCHLRARSVVPVIDHICRT